jgi:tetratricopeptide (TPR) repeat protein
MFDHRKHQNHSSHADQGDAQPVRGRCKICVIIYHAYILAASGQAAQGIPYAERALQLDPLTERAPYLNILGTVSFHAGEYQRSLDAFRRNQERGGPSPDSFEALSVAANVALGRLDVARTHLQILDSHGDSGNILSSSLIWFRHPDEAAEKVFGRIRELRDADVALRDNGE